MSSTRRQAWLEVTHLLVLEPGQALRGEDKPVVPAAALHDPQVVDSHVTLPDNLHMPDVNNFGDT